MQLPVSDAPSGHEHLQGRGLQELMSNCAKNTPRTTEATSVRTLHPEDLRVVAAIGDSITAAFAALNGLPVEFRGLSAVIGGDPDRVTLPNILEHFSGRHLEGAATDWTDPLADAAGLYPGRYSPLLPPRPGAAHLDAAISNGLAMDGPRQVDYLARVMSDEKLGHVSVQEDWKLVTILLGANDLMEYCRRLEPLNQLLEELIPKWKLAMNSTLAMIRKHFPRTFVALMAVPDVGEMGAFRHSSKVCSALHATVEKTSFCPAGSLTDGLQEGMNKALEQLQQFWNDVVHAEDFAVVYQPFSQKMNFPNVTYLSSLDCFHPGQHGHAEAAVNLWNSLLATREQKKHQNDIGAKISCPKASSILHVD